MRSRTIRPAPIGSPPVTTQYGRLGSSPVAVSSADGSPSMRCSTPMTWLVVHHSIICPHSASTIIASADGTMPTSRERPPVRKSSPSSTEPPPVAS